MFVLTFVLLMEMYLFMVILILVFVSHSVLMGLIDMILLVFV